MHEWILRLTSAGVVMAMAACASAESTGAEGTSVAEAAAAPVLMGVNWDAERDFEEKTGLRTQIVRAYLKPGAAIPTSTAAAGLDAHYAAGQAVVYSVQPENSPDGPATTKANLEALAKNIVAGGHASKTWLVIHHEPYHDPGVETGSKFQAVYSTYAPSVRDHGVRCGVVYQTYPLYHGFPNYAEAYTDGIIDQVDFIGIDVYPTWEPGDYENGILSHISPFTTYAKSHNKPFQIDEVAVQSDVPGGTAERQAAWLAGLTDLGGSATAVMYFEGPKFPRLDVGNNEDILTEWKRVYAALTGR